MNDILSRTSLPNLHPAMVHWPIVVLTLALLFDIAGLILVSRDWIRRTALILLVLGFLFSTVTWWSGKQASQTVMLTAGAEPVLSEHEDLANWTLRFFAVYLGLRLILNFFVSYRRVTHGVTAALAIPGLFLLYATADHGGSLVYQHGVGVRLPSNSISAPTPPESHTPHGVNGGPTVNGENFDWTFQEGSEADLTKYFEVKSTDVKTLNPKIENSNGKTALALTTNGTAPVQVLLKPIYKDAQIEVDLDRSDFKGKLSLIQHVTPSEYDYFSIDSNSISLGRKGKMSKTFENKAYKTAAGWVEYKSVSAGDHFRGYENGKLIVHGHGAAGPEGKVGLELEGTGNIRIAKISVHPVTETHD